MCGKKVTKSNNKRKKGGPWVCYTEKMSKVKKKALKHQREKKKKELIHQSGNIDKTKPSKEITLYIGPDNPPADWFVSVPKQTFDTSGLTPSKRSIQRKEKSQLMMNPHTSQLVKDTLKLPTPTIAPNNNDNPEIMRPFPRLLPEIGSTKPTAPNQYKRYSDSSLTVIPPKVITKPKTRTPCQRHKDRIKTDIMMNRPTTLESIHKVNKPPDSQFRDFIRVPKSFYQGVKKV